MDRLNELLNRQGVDLLMHLLQQCRAYLARILHEYRLTLLDYYGISMAYKSYSSSARHTKSATAGLSADFTAHLG